MRLVGNALNGVFFDELVALADTEALEHVALAVAAAEDPFEVWIRKSCTTTGGSTTV